MSDLVIIGAESLSTSWTKIGEGGFGEVFKAKHEWGWNVAIKLLCLKNSSFSREDLEHEARLMRRAENPFVMRVTGLYIGRVPNSEDEHVGIVMDLMERGSLDTLQEKLYRMPPWPLVFRLVHQVALGMNFLHSLTPALIHKDLKPQNVLLDAGLNVKITDFGLARFEDIKTAPKLYGACTPFFAPPEASGTEGATPAFDVYSYGILVWSILNSGHYYFKLNADMGKRPPLEDIDGMQAEGLDELLQLMKRCWSQKKEDRPSFKDCKDEAEGLYEKHRDGIWDAVFQVQKELDRGMDPHREACELTLDPNTAHTKTLLSENNRKVTWTSADQKYTDNPDRFKDLRQVMCKQRLTVTKRCSWVVEWSGRVQIAVAYRGLHRKGVDGEFGLNEKSWSLKCDGILNTGYTVCHNKEETELPKRPSSSSGRVEVRVDYCDGTVSFYTVSSDIPTLLHTFKARFTEPLYVGFRVSWHESSVCVIENKNKNS